MPSSNVQRDRTAAYLEVRVERGRIFSNSCAISCCGLVDTPHVRCITHVWGTGIVVAAALQALAMIAPCPPGLAPCEPLLELDRTYNPLREELNLTPPAIVPDMVFTIPTAPGIGFEPDRRVLDRYRVSA